MLADEVVHIGIFEIDGEVVHGLRIDIDDVHAHLASGQLLAQQCGLLEGVDLSGGVDAALKAEGGIGL